MSERWGACPHCRGMGMVKVENERRECGPCGGTGESGSALGFLQAQAQDEFDRTAHERTDWEWGR